MMIKNRYIFSITATILCVQMASSFAAGQSTNINSYYPKLDYTQSDFGGVGLLQTPTARFAEEGEFNFNYRDNDEYRRWSISLEPLSWLETTLRYTDTRTRLYSNNSNFSGDQTHKDKGIDLKIKLLSEQEFIPQAALGFKDLAGTGNFSAEHFTTSKRWNDFDFSLGLGWGYLGRSGNISNPFCDIKENYCYRETKYMGGSVGNFKLGDMFKGPSALFGGVEYQTPWPRIKLKLEYDPNDYKSDFAAEAGYKITQSTPWNFGLSYKFSDIFNSSLSYQRGNTLSFGFTLDTNFNKIKPAFSTSPSPKINNDKNQDDWAELSDEIYQQSGYKVQKIESDSHKLIIHAAQDQYRDPEIANEFTVDYLASVTEEKNVDMVSYNKNLKSTTDSFDLKAYKNNNDSELGNENEKVISEKQNTDADGAITELYSAPKDRWNFAVEPGLKQSLGGAENFYIYQLSARGNADFNITDALSLDSSADLNVINNYDKFNYKAPPADAYKLPRVRTWIREYVSSSDLLLTTLQLTYMNQIDNEWSYLGYAGYLETMYAGEGAEVLYQPQNQGWAISSNINHVIQRDWNNTMQLADYSVNTGHMTLYWQLPYVKGGLAKISAGRYLAGDKGITIDLSREFDSGVIIGAFATKTNVSAADYGEGSFTKGFYISIPLDLVTVHPTIKRSNIVWVPLTRDGGQMLDRRYSLYDLSKH